MDFQESLTDFSRLQITEQSCPLEDTEMSERDLTLVKELESVQNLNKVIEKTIFGLEKAQENMEIVERTVKDADKLLEQWIKILNQTEHTQRLVLNKKWYGATKDLLDIENEISRTKEQLQEAKSFEIQEKKITKEAKKELSNITYINNSDAMSSGRKARKEVTNTYTQNKKTTSKTNKPRR
ncbi:hypothetical protein PORY_002053 [Pneumocystis oryctolagi]|uniref:Uncharacterized protein n=1 Tax=Pneumocystis oryctolagi TaxID=42067 RepID=A0ACB7CC98_9ASCO|nr:hypothetical protein PORY_002053 [Pneumocystis oryctolagi]